MEKSDNLSILAETIATHARKLAHEEWNREYGSVVSEILKNAKIRDTLCADGREIPVETKELTARLTDQIVQAAFKKVLDQEDQSQ